MKAMAKVKTKPKAKQKTRRSIPFMDLRKQYESIKDEIQGAIQRVINSSGFTLSEEVELFEKEFASYCDTQFGIGVSSGTDALHLALLACGIGSNDEVITVPNTFIATTEAISMCGAKPVFVDINEKTYNIDVSQIEAKITEKTKAIIPVHLYGQPTEMNAINRIARKYELVVIEDACQAHGAMYKWQKAGSFGDAACFSFYPSKNLGAFGDGGIVVTNDELIAKRIQLLRNHGQIKKNAHLVEGFCDRLDGLQAAILRVKLKYLDYWNERRIINARVYEETLKGAEVITPTVNLDVKHVYHLYVVRTKERNKLQEKLLSSGISTGIHYPIPLHLQPAYSKLGYGTGDFPVAERVAKEIVSLPMFPELGKDEIEEIGSEIRKHVSQLD